MVTKKTLVFAVRFFLLLTLVFALSSDQAFPQNQEKSKSSSTFLFLIDTSLSMREGNRLGRVGEEVIATIKSWIEEGLIKDGDNLKIKRFDTRVHSVGSWVYTAEEERRIMTLINNRLKRLRPRGRTDIGKAVLTTLEKLKKQEAVFIVMFTDGEDIISRRDFKKILRTFREFYKEEEHGFFYVSLGVEPDITVKAMVEEIGFIFKTGEEKKLKEVIRDITDIIEPDIIEPDIIEPDIIEPDIIEPVIEVYLRLKPDRTNFGQVDPGKYSPLKSFTLSTNFTDISHASIEKAELQHPQGYKISEENIIISPERLSVSYDDPAEFRVKLKIPEEALAGEYSGKITFEIKEVSTTLAIRVSVSPWLKITGNPVDFGEVRAGKESESKPFTLTSNLPKLAEIAVKKYDLIDDKGHKILKDKVIISPVRLQVSAAFPQRFSLRIKVPEGTPEGKYEGKISFLIGGREKISLPARVKVIPFPVVTLLPLYPDKLLRHQPLRITAKLTPPELEILEIPIEVTCPDATLHPLILKREQKGIFSNKEEEFKPTKIGEYTFAIQPSKDYQIKNGEQQIKVNPPVISVVEKGKLQFYGLKKGDIEERKITLKAEKLYGPEILRIEAPSKEDLEKSGLINRIIISIEPETIILKPNMVNTSDSFIIKVECLKSIPWRTESLPIIISGEAWPEGQKIRIVAKVSGVFPWMLFSIVAGCLLALVGGGAWCKFKPTFGDEARVTLLSPMGAPLSEYELKEIQQKQFWKRAITIGSSKDDIDIEESRTLAKLLPGYGGLCKIQPLRKDIIRVNDRPIERTRVLPDNSTVGIKVGIKAGIGEKKLKFTKS